MSLKNKNIISFILEILCMILILGPYLLILTRQLEWYEKNKIYQIYCFINIIFLIIFIVY